MSCRGPGQVTEIEEADFVGFDGFGWSCEDGPGCNYGRPITYYYNSGVQVTKTSNVRDRRPMPPNPIYSLTCLQLQRSTLRVCGWKDYRKGSDSPPLILKRSNINTPYWRYPSMPVPSWENELRRNINQKVGAAVGETAFETVESVRNLYRCAQWFWQLYRCVRSLGFKKCSLMSRRCKSTPLRNRRDVGNSRKDFLKALRCINGVDLGAKFSIKPNLNLIIDMYQRSLDVKHGHILRVVAGGRSEQTDIHPLYYDYQVRRVLTAKAVCYLALNQDAPVWHINVPQTLWEIVPLSFVLDWLIDVGSELEALMLVNRKHYTYLGGTVTYKRVTRTIFDEQQWFTGWHGITATQPDRTTTVEHWRDVLGGIPNYRVTPWEDNVLNNPTWGKLQTALQLLLAIRGGGRGPRRGPAR